MRIAPLASLITLGLALAAGPAAAQQNIDKIFGGITAQANEQYGSLASVNGGISVRDGATVRKAETVNGGISIGKGAHVGSAETVNGGITVGEDATVGTLEAVNGGISLARGVRVERDASTVNGGIRGLEGVQIGGDVETVNGGLSFEGAIITGRLTTTQGDITLLATQVRGGVLVEKPGFMGRSGRRFPRIVIGPDSVVEGTLVFEHDVELFVHASAKIGTVTGATPQAYTDKLPPRR